MNTLFIILTILGIIGFVVALMLYLGAKRELGDLREQRLALVHEREVAQQHFQQEHEQRVSAETMAKSSSEQLSELQAELVSLREERVRLTKDLASERASAEGEIQKLREQNQADREAERLVREQQEAQFRLQFKTLATEILNEQSAQFKQTNKESVEILLKPFRDNITEFRKRVEDIYASQTSQRGELKAELKNLMELNQRITTETTNLTNALKGNSKVQGDWGEMLLETILDSSSLSKGIHYQTQYNIKDEEGKNLRPDVVLHLPEKKHIIIDSKVSLTAFVAYTSAASEEDRKRYLKAHIDSVRQHVTELGRKEYQRLLKSPDFVIMFVPNEPAFLAALQSDPTIWSDAYEKKIIISSPTNLFALLKMVADMWKYNDQDKNTKLIATSALKLYEQAVRFSTSLENVGVALSKAQDAYDDAHKRLCTGNDNIVRVGEQLRKKARLQSKQHFSTALIDADDNSSEEELPELEEATTTGL